MQICKECNTKMVGVISFSKDKHEKFDRCQKCYSEGKHRKIDSKELDFREELSKEIRKRK